MYKLHKTWHTIISGTLEHGTMEYETPVEQQNTGRTAEH